MELLKGSRWIQTMFRIKKDFATTDIISKLININSGPENILAEKADLCSERETCLDEQL